MRAGDHVHIYIYMYMCDGIEIKKIRDIYIYMYISTFCVFWLRLQGLLLGFVV